MTGLKGKKRHRATASPLGKLGRDRPKKKLISIRPDSARSNYELVTVYEHSNQLIKISQLLCSCTLTG